MEGGASGRGSGRRGGVWDREGRRLGRIWDKYGDATDNDGAGRGRGLV